MEVITAGNLVHSQPLPQPQFSSRPSYAVSAQAWDPCFADKTWKVLEDAIHEINNHNASGLSFEELYRQASIYLLPQLPLTPMPLPDLHHALMPDIIHGTQLLSCNTHQQQMLH